MKEKILINARIVDPSQKLDCIGGLIIDSNGKIKAIGKNINKNIASKNAEIIEQLRKKDGLIIIHRNSEQKEVYFKEFKILEEKKYGISKIIFGIILN